MDNYFAVFMQKGTEKGFILTDRGGFIVGQIQAKGRAVGMDIFKAAVDDYFAAANPNGVSAAMFLRGFDTIANRVRGRVASKEIAQRRMVMEALGVGR